MAEPATISALVTAVAKVFQQYPLFYGHGTDNPDDEAFTLVFAVLDRAFEQAETVWHEVLNPAQIDLVTSIAEQRIEKRIPLSYLTGKAWFAGLPFIIDQRALIPRSPIAELIQNRFSPWLQAGQSPRILDLCTGNGCIGIAAAVFMPDVSVDLADLSADALDLARQNVQKYELEGRVNVIQSDLFEALEGRQYDLIVSNPPYVPASSMEKLPEEYHHEPSNALEADDGGMAIVDKILEQSGNYMKNNGILIVEVGEIQIAVEQRYTSLPFIWLDFERGGEGVFLLHRQDLESPIGDQ